MLTQYKIDNELSKFFYEKYKDVLGIKECYYNVAKIFLSYDFKKDNLSNIKVTFGAWQITLSDKDNVFARHCFLLIDDKIVDPTNFLTAAADRTYLIFKTFEMEEYKEKLKECAGDAYLPKYIEPMYREMALNLSNKGIYLVG